MNISHRHLLAAIENNRFGVPIPAPKNIEYPISIQSLLKKVLNNVLNTILYSKVLNTEFLLGD